MDNGRLDVTCIVLRAVDRRRLGCGELGMHDIADACNVLCRHFIIALLSTFCTYQNYQRRFKTMNVRVNRFLTERTLQFEKVEGEKVAREKVEIRNEQIVLRCS